MSQSSVTSRELWIDNWFNTGVDRPLENLVVDTKRDIGQ